MTHITTADGVRYAVGTFGHGDPLLLIHGFTGSSRSWTPLLPGMTRDHRVLAIDLLGHGDSDAPAADRVAVDYLSGQCFDTAGDLVVAEFLCAPANEALPEGSSCQPIE